MSNLSDSAISQGDVMHRIVELEKEVKKLKSLRRLESASIGSGGLRLLGGDITVDEGGNIVITGGRIIAGDPEGDRAEITSAGYRLVNGDGVVDIDLTTEGEGNLIRLRGAGSNTGETQTNEILLNNSGEINGRVLNVDAINLDGQSLSEILDVLADAATPTSGGADEDSPPPEGTITRRYDAIWSQCYKGDGTKNNFSSGLNQGHYSGTNGNQRSLIGFDSSEITNDHGGRTITRVRVYLYFNHWYFNSGGTAVIGYHTHGSEPNTFSANADEVRSSDWPKPGGRWVSIDTGSWANGTRKGVALGPGPSSGNIFYGNLHDHNGSNPPRLEIRSEP